LANLKEEERVLLIRRYDGDNETLSDLGKETESTADAVRMRIKTLLKRVVLGSRKGSRTQVNTG